MFLAPFSLCGGVRCTLLHYTHTNYSKNDCSLVLHTWITPAHGRMQWMSIAFLLARDDADNFTYGSYWIKLNYCNEFALERKSISNKATYSSTTFITWHWLIIRQEFTVVEQGHNTQKHGERLNWSRTCKKAFKHQKHRTQSKAQSLARTG